MERGGTGERGGYGLVDAMSDIPTHQFPTRRFWYAVVLALVVTAALCCIGFAIMEYLKA